MEIFKSLLLVAGDSHVELSKKKRQNKGKVCSTVTIKFIFKERYVFEKNQGIAGAIPKAALAMNLPT